MSQNSMYPYAEGPGYQAVALPYKGDEMSMIILYLIRDNETGTILFLGRVLNPGD